MKANFYICPTCGNLVYTVHNAGVPLLCCGQKMQKLEPNTVEASGEKHLPVAALEGDTLHVSVGSVEHPMAAEHMIQWIFVETEQGGQIRYLAGRPGPQGRLCAGRREAGGRVRLLQSPRPVDDRTVKLQDIAPRGQPRGLF